MSDKHKQKLSLAHKGKKFSDEHKKKISESKKGTIQTQEHKTKIAIAKKGYKHTEETKRKISDKRKLQIMKPITNETRNKMSRIMKGRTPWNKGFVGDKSPGWKGGVTINTRNSNEYQIWRLSVYSKDHYMCQKCNQIGKNLHAHHIYNFAQYPGLKFIVENGITICNRCHRLFHHIYGRKNNSLEQILEFLTK